MICREILGDCREREMILTMKAAGKQSQNTVAGDGSATRDLGRQNGRKDRRKNARREEKAVNDGAVRLRNRWRCALSFA
jgi:hypothetical protein